MTNDQSRGQSSTALIVLGAMILVGVVGVGVAVLGGFVDAPVTGSDEATATPPTPTKIPTLTPTSTPTATKTLTSTPTGTPTLSPTPTLTPTPTPTPTVTPTATPTATPEEDPYLIFMATFAEELKHKPAVPVRVRGWYVVDTEFYVVVNLTAKSEDGLQRLKEQNGMLSAYAQTLLFYDQGKVSGDAPSGLRILEVDNTDRPPKTTFANNSVVREWSSAQISTIEFHSQVYSTTRNQTAAEREDVRNIDRGAKNYTFHNGTATPTED